MTTRVAKATLKNILWSAILAGISCLLLLDSEYWAADFLAFVASVAFASGLIAFAFYEKIRVGGILGSMVNALAWSIVLALYGGIGVSLLGVWVLTCIDGECGGFGETLVVVGSVPVSFAAGLITFTAYEASKWVKLNLKQRNKSHHLAHH